VLVVNEERRNLDRILICTAGEVDQGVVRVGARLAQRAEAETTVLHVANPVPTMYTGLEAMEETLPELLQRDTPVAGHLRDSARRLAEKEVEAEVQLRYGEATDQILREARSGDYDLVVIGPGAPAGSLRRFLMTEVTSEVVARAPCPVLVVRGGCRQ
jgi:nucleotide-binding universal stress UspA family protein